MILCGEECSIACDFCMRYIRLYDKDGWFEGIGYCKEHKRIFDFGDYCEDFHCFRVEEEVM